MNRRENALSLGRRSPLDMPCNRDTRRCQASRSSYAMTPLGIGLSWAALLLWEFNTKRPRSKSEYTFILRFGVGLRGKLVVRC